MQIQGKIAKTVLLISLLIPLSAAGEIIITSWYTKDSGKYARIWATIEDETAEKMSGNGLVTSQTTWNRADYPGNNIGIASGDQTLPVYAGIQGIMSTDTDVYIKSTGLATHTMGPWYDNIYVRDTLFASFPGNAAILYRFPRSTNYGPDYISTNQGSHPGTCGLFVNGVPLYNTTDTFGYVHATGADGGPGAAGSQGDGVWNCDAFVNEGPTFDAGFSHQAMEAHHYHANPPALRHLLGDSVDYDPDVVYTGLVSQGGTNPYTENFNGMHSPIIGWVNDGLPMYGPYGFSDPDDASSMVRLMVTGYQKRDGSNGSYNLVENGRDLLPKWVVSLGIAATTAVAADETGPEVSDSFVLGHYMEDNAFKGDLISETSGVAFELYTDPMTQGAFDPSKHYDLNLYNVRYCVTPEFPEGTWAYFTAISENGNPVYPYNLAPSYFGDPTLAGGVSDIPEDAKVVFAGAASTNPGGEKIMRGPGTNEITVVWEVVEGGQYRIETSSNLETWDTNGASTTSESTEIRVIDSTTGTSQNYYRIIKTGLSEFDETEFGTGTGGPGGGGPGGDRPGPGGLEPATESDEPGTGNPADGFVFSFADLPPQQDLALNIQVGDMPARVIHYSSQGPQGGTMTLTFDASGFESGNEVPATFSHQPPGQGSVVEYSTNTYKHP